jgi:hypothetical protein
LALAAGEGVLDGSGRTPELKRKRGGDPGAAARRALHLEPASQRGEAILEADEATAVGAGAADAVVAHVHVQQAVLDPRLTFALSAPECLTTFVSASATTK